MAKERTSYPSDVSDEEWAFCVPYLTLMKEDAPQRQHELRALFNALRWFVRAGCPWRMLPHDLHAVRRRAAGRKAAPTAAILDSRTLQSTPESGGRAQVGALAEAVQAATGKNVELAYVDQGYTGEKPAAAAQEHGLRLEVMKHHEAKHGFVLLPKRWVVERTFAWAARFRRRARDYERLAETVAAYHWLALASLRLHSLFAMSA